MYVYQPNKPETLPRLRDRGGAQAQTQRVMRGDVVVVVILRRARHARAHNVQHLVQGVGCGVEGSGSRQCCCGALAAHPPTPTLKQRISFPHLSLAPAHSRMLTMKLPTNDGNIRGLNVLSSHLNNNANVSPVEPQSISRIFGRPVDLQADELCVFFYRRTAPSCAAANRVG